MKDSPLLVLDKFSEKIKRSHNSDSVKRAVSFNKLDELIQLEEEDFREMVSKNFRKYAYPMAKEIEDDQNELTAAYTLFKEIMEVKARCEVQGVKLSPVSIEVSLTRKKDYFQNGMFIFLAQWLFRVEKLCDYVPFIKEKKLYFCKASEVYDHHIYTAAEKRVIQVLDEIFTTL